LNLSNSSLINILNKIGDKGYTMMYWKFFWKFTVKVYTNWKHLPRIPILLSFVKRFKIGTES